MRNIFNKIGFLNEKFSSAYDYDYWFRVLEAGYRLDYIEKPLAIWRTHIGQESRNIKKAKLMLVGILKSFLKRRPDFSGNILSLSSKN
jgi:GT2 family glycosyltransferase